MKVEAREATNGQNRRTSSPVDTSAVAVKSLLGLPQPDREAAEATKANAVTRLGEDQTPGHRGFWHSLGRKGKANTGP
jgi:hypothetical protein